MESPAFQDYFFEETSDTVAGNNPEIDQNECQSLVAFLSTVHYEREDLEREERWGAVKH